jgi:hypothetical protein
VLKDNEISAPSLVGTRVRHKLELICAASNLLGGGECRRDPQLQLSKSPPVERVLNDVLRNQ